MKKIFLIFLLFNIALQAWAYDIPDAPKPPRLVNDLADIFTRSQENSLERRLVAYSDSTSTQIVVVTLTSINGADPNLFAAELGEKWGVGRSTKDNGIVILIAKNDRRVAIQVGYGIEALVPDAMARRLIDNYIVPDFKKGNFYRGVYRATDVLYSLLTGAYQADELNNDGFGDASFFIFLLILAIIILVIISVKYGDKMKEGRTFDEKGMNPRRLPRQNKRRHRRTPTRRRSSGPWWGSGGGGGGWSGGGSSSGGGSFGGFGGGSFGGGGASGSW